MDKLLEFVDRLCLDERLYWHVSHLDGHTQAEVTWERAARPHGWRVRPHGAAAWRTVPTAELEATLTELSIDRAAFERQLGASILTQAVFADMVMEGALRLFGDDVVTRSIRDTRAFLASLSETTARLTQAASEPARPSRRLRLVSRE